MLVAESSFYIHVCFFSLFCFVSLTTTFFNSVNIPCDYIAYKIFTVSGTAPMTQLLGGNKAVTSSENDSALRFVTSIMYKF